MHCYKRSLKKMVTVMNDPLFSTDELAAMATTAEEAQREADAYCEWLLSPEGRAWGDQVLQECRAMAEEFEQDCVAGKFGLSVDELAKLRRDAEAFAEEVRTGKYNLSPDEMKELFDRGRLVKCHAIKSGGVASD